MDPLAEEEARQEAAVWQAVALFSTLSTAATVWHAAQERRAGRDPSEQEEALLVRSYLRTANGELQALLMQLRASLISVDRSEEGRIVSFVRRFHHLMGLYRLSRFLGVIHQRLLSLYPDVAEEVVEEARVLARRAGLFLEAEGEVFYLLLEPFLEETLCFSTRLHHALTVSRRGTG